MKRTVKALIAAGTVITAIAVPIAANTVNVDLKRINFGMTREEVNGIIGAKPNERDEYTGFCSAAGGGIYKVRFEYSGNALYTVSLITPIMNETKAEKQTEKKLSKLSGIFGLSEDDWEEQGACRYASVCDTDIKLKTLQADGKSQILIDFCDLDYVLFNDPDKTPIIP